MKERRTPIERIPHLGFKQINLWKIYKAVEKLGAYELVTGRRLWKNVYDELGGSPGSTSAATCTRRHYERLVLPYVRHLKGEEDKPLPPAKPRRQYKGSKGGHEPAEKTRRSRKEKSREQVPTDQAKVEAVAAPEAGGDATMDAPERRWPLEGPSGPAVVASLELGPVETNQRLFCSLPAKGPRTVMSPLAKKKLLAHVSKEEALHHPKRHCPESRPAEPTASQWDEHRSPEAPGATGRQSHLPAAPAVFTGCFHAYGPEALPGPGCHAARGRRCGSPELSEPGWSGAPGAGARGGPCATLAAVQACWVPPGAASAPTRDESLAFPATSRFGKEADEREKGAGHLLAKPKAVVATYAAPLGAGPPDGYKGAMLHLPLSAGSAPERPSPVQPVLIPAFPRPLVAAPTPPGRLRASGGGRYPYEGSLRQRLYGWPAQSAFYRHSAL
ncbi:AT-rich interactive domain-containing protein 5A [Eudromia elegans]